jgi:sensor domain CHASE-containing protein
MEQNSENSNDRQELKKALSIIETQSAIINQLHVKVQQLEQINQDLQLQLAQLKKLVFGSRHEKFVGSAAQMAPTLFVVCSFYKS